MIIFRFWFDLSLEDKKINPLAHRVLSDLSLLIFRSMCYRAWCSDTFCYKWGGLIISLMAHLSRSSIKSGLSLMKRKSDTLELYQFQFLVLIHRETVSLLMSLSFCFVFFLVSSHSCGGGAEWNKKENDRVGMFYLYVSLLCHIIYTSTGLVFS